jgi:hypothetical protein
MAFARWTAAVAFAIWASVASAATAGHYMFVWSGDANGEAEDFLAVIDADPASPGYGNTVASVASGIKSQEAHHTEYWMPESGLLFANDHKAGKTAVFDLRDPLHPTLHASFGDLEGFSHPHSYLRLPNGHVLASFQVEGHMHHGTDGSVMPMTEVGTNGGSHGGIVEIDEEGHAIRAASTEDKAHPSDLLMAYSLLPLPDLDRVVVTNSPMRGVDMTGYTYQIFRLSDLKLLSTNAFDAPAGRYGETNPEEARRGPDGSVFVQTFGCGIERITDIAAPKPKSKLVYQFPGGACGVPSIVSHYLIQTVPILRSVVVLDIGQPDHPKEVSRLKLDGVIEPHWTGYDPVTQRVAVTGYAENKLFLLKFDPSNGALTLDKDIDLNNRPWPHGWTGTAIAHGVVFSR